MIISVNFQMTELKNGAKPISMGVATKPTNDSPIHIFYAEFSNVDYSKVSEDQMNWLNDNVRPKLLWDDSYDKSDRMMDTIAEKLSSNNVKTTFKYGDSRLIGLYFKNWLRYIKRSYNMMDDDVEFLADITAYDKVLITEVLGADGVDLWLDPLIKLSPYDICMNSLLASRLIIPPKDAFEINRFNLLNDESSNIYKELSGGERIELHAFYNCLETLLLYNQLPEVKTIYK